MFSGIVEEMATLVALKNDKENVDLTLTCSFTNELKIDQSVAHNGVCLTVVAIDGDRYTVTAMKETLDRSNLGELKVGDRVNVERSMLMNGRLDGHIVQGHVDGTAVCKEMRDADGSTYYTFEYKFDREMAERGYFTVDKGSVTVNGVSLTVCNPTENSFTVAIIPYTHDNTNFCDIKVGSRVNIEFEIPSRGIIGLRTNVLTASQGEAIMAHRFKEYQPYKGEITRRSNGSMIALETGTAYAYAIDKLQDRGKFFIDPGEEVYGGEVVGEHVHDNDLVVNVTKAKQLTNVRASGSDDKARVIPKTVMSLEECLEYIREDEYVEVTPKNMRMRKIELDHLKRKRSNKD